MSVYGSKILDIPKKLMKTLLNILLTVKKGMAKCVNSTLFQDKK